MAYFALDRAAELFDGLRRVVAQRMAERVVDGDEVPALRALLDQRTRGAVGQGIGVTEFGEQAFPVRSEEPADETSIALFFCLLSSRTANATAELAKSTTTSTFSCSYQRRAMAAPTSALF